MVVAKTVIGLTKEMYEGVSKRGYYCRLVGRGEVRSPENSLFCVFGQANSAPTADDGIDRFGFDTLHL